ncbi:hypothetical protein FF1_019146 [Malus domestica]|uniref:zinc finger protein STOP1 homolog n=1 Tax=Malus domestica TaxID=3750 RepID=UPI00397666A9
MSFPRQPFHTPLESSVESLNEDTDTVVPLRNLSMVRTRMDSLQYFLTDSIHANALISKDQMDMVSAGIASAIHEIISNGAALLALSQNPIPSSDRTRTPAAQIEVPEVKKEVKENNSGKDDADGGEIVEVDAMELLAEHIHYCEICGKGFKRDANLRMHMRAHGNRFKTPEALAKPDKTPAQSSRNSRFSCPYVGCNRNKEHGKFRPLKSVICVKNHFKRSHCPKMYSCNRCNKKSFSVVADLKSHLKHCGEARWRCTCGTSFSRKSKLFGHMALFEGHMPAVEDEKSGGESKVVTAMEQDDDDEEEEEEEEEGMTTSSKGTELNSSSNIYKDIEFSDELLNGFGSIDDYFLEDMLTDL